MTSPPPQSRPRVGPARSGHPYLLLSAASLFWAGNFVIGRAVHGHVPPLALAFWRWALALLVLLPFTWQRLRADAPALLRSWRTVVALGVLGVGNFNMLVYVGLQDTTATNALLLNAAGPAFIGGIAFAVGSAHPSARQLLGIAASLLGVLVIVSRGSPGRLLDLSFNRGDLWVLAAVLSWAAYTVALAKRPARVDALAFLTATMIVGVAWIAPFYGFELARGARPILDLKTAAAMLYVALLPSIAAFVCYNQGVALIGAHRAGVFLNLMPAFGTGLAVVLLVESFHAFQAGGIALIVCGVWLAGSA